MPARGGKIAIISDSHDNVPNIEKFLNWAKKNKVEMIIHCGDVAAPVIIKKLFAEKFKGEMHLVHGNVSDRDLLEEVCDEYDHITLHGDEGELNFEGETSTSRLQVAFCHFPDQAKELAESGKYQLVFYGHTHKPWIESLKNGCQLINPGTLGGLFQKPTFAVFNTENNDLKLENLEEL